MLPPVGGRGIGAAPVGGRGLALPPVDGRGLGLSPVTEKRIGAALLPVSVYFILKYGYCYISDIY